MRLVLVPMLEDKNTVLELAGLLSRVYPGVAVEVAGRVAEPPPGSYDEARGQYRSEQILFTAAALREALGAGAVLLVAGVDAYADALNFVFGEALLGEDVAVVYTPRLRPEYYGYEPDKGLFMERLLKESMHELGHAFGLEHCPNPLCVMSFSNSILEVDRKKPAYCTHCAAKLRARGIMVAEEYIL